MASPATRRRPAGLTIAEPGLFAPGNETQAAQFCRRAFAVPALRAIEIDPQRARASLRWTLAFDDDAATLAAIAEALQVGPAIAAAALPPWRPGAPVQLRRRGALLSTLEILDLGPGRLRVRHPALGAEPATVRRILNALDDLPGIRSAAVSSALGILELAADPRAGDMAAILRLIEQHLAEPAETPEIAAVEPTSFAMPNLALAVAAVGEFVTPAADPIAAGLLIYGNLATLRAGGVELAEGRPGLPTLYTGIVAATLLSGGFLSAATMFWFFRHWERVHRQDMAEAADHLLAALHRPAGEAAPPAGGVFGVAAGEVVPADGVVTTGCALVEEAPPGAPAKSTRKATGDPVRMGSLVRAGRLELAASRSQTAPLVQAALAAHRPDASLWTLTREAERFAARSVVPTFAVAAVGLALGGAGMANSVLRPDYATGVGLAAPLRRYEAAHRALRHDALILRPEALGPLAAARWVVIDDHPDLLAAECSLAEITLRHGAEDRLLPLIAAAGAWLGDARGAALLHACGRRGLLARHAMLTAIDEVGVTVAAGGVTLRLREGHPGGPLAPLRVEIDGVEAARLRFAQGGALPAATAIAALREAGLRVALASERPAPESAQRARRLGANAEASALTEADRIALLAELSADGTAVLHLCDGPGLPTAEDRVISVALADRLGPRQGADIALLDRSLAPLPALVRLAREQAGALRRDRQTVVALNAAAVAGVLALGLGGLQVVLLSNLGTWMVHRRAHRSLAGLRLATLPEIRIAEAPPRTAPATIPATEEAVPMRVYA